MNSRKSTILENYRKTLVTAFQKDCDNFFRKFEKFKSFTYESFALTWQLSDFTNIYALQTYSSTLQVLCEYCFQTLKLLMLNPSSSLYSRIAAFYMLYGLYYKQPVKNMVRIRILMEEYKSLKNLLEIMKVQGFMDPLYCFIKLKSDNAFMFVAHQIYLKLDNHKTSADSFAVENMHMKDTEGSLTKFEQLNEDPMIRDLENTCDEYNQKLKKFAEKCSSLAPFETTVMSEFKKTYENVTRADQKFLSPKKAEMGLHAKRQKIKSRAIKKKGQYRGNKKCLTKLNLEEQLAFGKMKVAQSDESNFESEDEDDPDYNPAKQ